MSNVQNYRRMSSAAAMILAFLGACTSSRPAQNLGGCWNINELDEGLVRGEGIFTTSMEGLSLQPPDCLNPGFNHFELNDVAGQMVTDFNGAAHQPRIISFSFAGRVVDVGAYKTLAIHGIDELKVAPEPKWMTELRGVRPRS